ncbi:MAG: hypothetical protein K8S13_01275, partial [Desulfobacula sp.]|uniref:SGNH/GDSL hydrolase family protein n=1 Tax=Desulfobacula sp. TaxID=2593537 RepID=UPI0025BB566F
QVGMFSGSGFTNYNNTLFTVWAGPNDFFQGSMDPISSVDNIIGAVQALDGFGAQHILVPNMPDLGITPGAYLLSPTERAGLTALTNGFNFYLHQALAASGVSATIFEMDVQQIMYDMMGEFGNVTDNCYLENGFYAWGLAGDYMFWDDVHPTTKAHMILAEYATDAVPVPAAIWLLGSGLLFLVGIKRKTH